MFVLNRMKKDIELKSFEGYQFTIPTGVSWIWDKAGEHLIQNIYKVNVQSQKDKFGYDNGNGVPPLLESNLKSWLKEGKKLTQVKKFVINESLIPRDALIAIAAKQGVDNATITKWLANKNLDKSEIAEAINSLPVPDSVRYPENLETLGVENLEPAIV